MKAEKVSVSLVVALALALALQANAQTPSTGASTAKPAAAQTVAPAINDLLPSIAAANAAGRKQAVEAAVLSIVRNHSRELVESVRIISEKYPEFASVAAAKAVSLQPELDAKIVTASVEAAPKKAGAIVEGVLTANPAASFQSVGEAALTAASTPAQVREILKAISLTVLPMKPGIDKVLSGSGDITVATAKSVLRQGAAQVGKTTGSTTNKPGSSTTGGDTASSSSSSSSSSADQGGTSGNARANVRASGFSGAVMNTPPSFTGAGVTLGGGGATGGGGSGSGGGSTGGGTGGGGVIVIPTQPPVGPYSQ